MIDIDAIITDLQSARLRAVAANLPTVILAIDNAITEAESQRPVPPPPPPPPPPPSGVVITDQYIQTPKDTFPRLTFPATNSTDMDGDWNDPLIWSARSVPDETDVVALGHRVNLEGTASVQSIEIGGDLFINPGASVTLTHCVVLPGGRLSTAGEIVFRDVPIDLTRDPYQIMNGLIVFGRIEAFGVYPAVPFDSNGVANLTRSITMRSENPLGTRGHLMMTASASCELLGIRCQDMGRTLGTAMLNSAFVKPDGTVQPGTNQIARYSLHFHHNRGPQQKLVRGCVVARDTKWGYTVHGSTGVVIEDCIASDIAGGGFVTEDSTELDCQFRRNLALDIRNGWASSAGGVKKFYDADGIKKIDVATDGSGFWFRRAAAVASDNLAIRCITGHNVNGYYLERDPTSPTQNTFAFERNISRDCELGYWVTYSRINGPIGSMKDDTPELVIADCQSFDCPTGVEAYHDANLTFDGCAWLISNPTVGSALLTTDDKFYGRLTKGFNLAPGNYQLPNLKILNCDVAGYQIGLVGPNTLQDTVMFVSGGTWDNFINFAMTPTMSNNDFDGKQIEFSNLTLLNRPGLITGSVSTWFYFNGTYKARTPTEPYRYEWDGLRLYYDNDPVLPADAVAHPQVARGLVK